MRIRWWAGVLIMVGVLAAAIAGYRQFYLIPVLRESVLRQLKDPDSAQFRDEYLMGPWTVSETQLCGQVNSRTPMGGYGGFKSFYASSEGRVFFYEEGDKMAQVMCAKAKKGEIPWWWLG